MPSDLENLRTRRSAILAELAALTSTSQGGRVNQTAMGRSFDHVGYKDGLYRELEAIDKLIANADDGSGEGGSFEIETQGLI